MNAMKRILILGSSGSGKSTLARQLGAKKNLPVIFLDQHFWRAGWRESTDEQWQATLEKLIQRDQWIMDGTFSGFVISSKCMKYSFFMNGAFPVIKIRP